MTNNVLFCQTIFFSFNLVLHVEQERWFKKKMCSTEYVLQSMPSQVNSIFIYCQKKVIAISILAMKTANTIHSDNNTWRVTLEFKQF